MKKVLMIVAANNFRDEEYLEPRRIFDQSGFAVTVASSSTQTAVGMLGARVETQILVDQAEAEDFDGLIFVGGGGAREYYNSAAAHSLAKNMVAANKPLGAICIAPMILANAGLLAGRNFTAFSSIVNEIKVKGGNFVDQGTVLDNLILTADGPESAEQFGVEFSRLLV